MRVSISSGHINEIKPAECFNRAELIKPKSDSVRTTFIFSFSQTFRSLFFLKQNKNRQLNTKAKLHTSSSSTQKLCPKKTELINIFSFLFLKHHSCPRKKMHCVQFSANTLQDFIPVPVKCTFCSLLVYVKGTQEGRQG